MKHLICIFLFIAMSATAFAQATATITGRVTDAADAVVPNASIMVTNVATGVARNTVTNSEGLYTVPALAPGNYNVKAELQGFQTVQRNNIELLTGATLSVDFRIQLGTVQQTVEVAAQAAAIETTQSVGSSTIQQSEVDSLPMVNRSMSSLMALLPGAREVAASTPSRNFISVGGGVGYNFNTVVDGVDDKEDHNGGTVMTYSLDGIQEFRTLTTGANAEYGKGAAQILVTTKSGSNQLHGSAFGYYRNQNLERIDYFSDPAHGGLGKPPLTHEQYGGSVGGPIIKDKLFYFGSVERDSQDYSIPVSPTILAQQRALLFLNDATGYAHNYIQVNPYEHTPNHELLAQAKINYTLSPKHSMFARYSSEVGALSYGSGTSPSTAGSVNSSGLTISPYQTTNYQHLYTVSLGETFVINPTTVNQFTAQWQQYSHDNRYPTCPMSIPSLGVNSCLGDALVFAGGVSTSFISAFPDYTNWEHKWQFKDDIAKQFGRHSLKFGADYSYIPLFGGLLAVFGPGTITFNKSPTTILALPQGFQTPGIVSNLVEWSGIDGDYGTPPAWEAGLYGQDDFKVTSTLTLNLGLRWDANNLGYDTKADQALNPTYQILKAVGSPYGALPDLPNWKNFAPRAGLAWDVGGNGKNVIRASFGLFYLLQEKISNYAQDVLQKPNPFVQTQLGPAQLANFIFGVTPLPPINAVPTTFSPGSNATGYWYDPHIKTGTTQQYHGGWAHAFGSNDILTVDFTYDLTHHGWRWKDINPLINGVRPLAAATQALYGDPKLLGPVILESDTVKANYNETAVHYEHRLSAKASFQVNYILSFSNAYGGNGDGSVGSGGYPQIPSPTGGLLFARWEYGPTSVDERHRFTATGIFNIPFKIEVAPSLTFGTARPYTLVSGPNPSGDGNAQLKGADGNPMGINTQRGSALFDINARVTRTFPIKGERLKLAAFAELYNITDRANFGNVYGGTFGSPTYQKPIGYLGGSGATSNIPVSFQVQFGGRFSF